MNKTEKISELLTRGVGGTYPSEKFIRAKLESGEKLHVYLGIDPTGPTLHLGHIVQLLKLRQFQNLGHQIYMLIGDFTAMIGDPTDKSAVRKPLTREQVLVNCERYKEQASKLIAFDGDNPAKIVFNSHWLSKMSFGDVVELASHFTVQQLLERDMFEKRMEEGKPIHLHEFLYPLMQGYDTYCITDGGVDGEIGGTDQIFNMLAGRTLLKDLNGKEKFVLANKLLVDPTGAKMGKTTGNMIALNQTSQEMYGAVMSWTDGLILGGFELCTTCPMEKITEVEKRLEAGENPKALKMELAHTIVEMFFDTETAEATQAEFDRMFRDKGTPDEMPEVALSSPFSVLDKALLEEVGMSGGEVRRLVAGGGVKINDAKITDLNTEYEIPTDGVVVKFGKRKFVKIVKK